MCLTGDLHRLGGKVMVNADRFYKCHKCGGEPRFHSVNLRTVIVIQPGRITRVPQHNFTLNPGE